MKRKIWAITAALLMISGIVSADGLNGSYNGNPIVRITANGSTITDDIPAQIIDDKTMVPLTMLRKLGVTVTWDQATYTADVKLPKQHANVLSQAELDSISRNVGIVYALDAKSNNIGQGSGFVLPNGYFVTNAHVWKGASSLKITIDGKKYNVTKPLIVNEKTDIVIASIDANSTLKIAKDAPVWKDKTYAIGFPNGEFTVSIGEVMINDYENGVNVIKSLAKISPGSSGGLLINEWGEVIGVTSATIDRTELGMSVSVKYVQQELDKLK